MENQGNDQASDDYGIEDSGEVVFLRTAEEDAGSSNDIWDDTALIKAYDRAIKQVQKGNSNTSGNNKKKKGKKKNQRKPTKQWRVGDTCMARYTEDQQLYEAVITEVVDQNRCTVLYTEYGNEEEQLLENLLHAYNKQTRNGHSRTSSASMSCSECSSSLANQNPGRSFLPAGPHPSKQKPLQQHQPNTLPHMGMPSFIPPPPPSLPDMSGCDTDEAFHSMLISWYMSGFHTGYYQGLKDGRQTGFDS